MKEELGYGITPQKEFDKTTNGGNMTFLVDCGGDSVKLEIFEFDTGYFTEDQVEVPTRGSS